MKWSTTVSLAVAPLAAMAASNKMRKTYPVSVNPRAEAASQLDGRSIAIINGMKGHGLNAGALDQVVIIWVNPGNNAPTTSINKPAHPGAGQGEATETPGQGEAPPVEAPPAESATTTTASESETTTAPAAGASHTVKVGGPGGLVFEPDQLNIPVGDSVIFEFLSQNHTVTQSPFDTPCKALEGGMDSGFLANPNNTVNPPPQVAMQVMATTPLWFYCKQKGHCGKGMVFSINPTANKTQAIFQSMAIAQNGTGEATPITGGTGNPGAAPELPPPANAEEPKESTTSEPEKEEPTSSLPAEEPAATETPTSPAAGGEGEGSAEATTGTGTVGADGSCTCVVACNAGGFPAAAQGAGAFGGFAGTLPTKMAAMR
ncbi:Cupredoxin [Beauveria brongniartii RCEF 3172]|uniref:Cupredoxin n=1 Tax=Beauveria brongniartii RCEF 3172 TaxID=1081107 RepID=A0A162JS48_9HYPO|nr:Cupredoxin [Beauveria brongniartii RCEF 3172]